MAPQLVTADTSVVVPALVSWHEQHETARNAVIGVTRLPAHVLLETISVLTRLPHGLSVPTALAVGLLKEAFPAPPLLLDGPGHSDLLDMLAGNHVRGKTIFDAVIAAAARAAGAVLRTRDRRATEVYRAVGVTVEYVD
ncbi:MAG: PIN domain-containing protein [Actinobacteria bacterium]|nr:PIN domain-containing protein [Actinomycetota bacterium]